MSAHHNSKSLDEIIEEGRIAKAKQREHGFSTKNIQTLNVPRYSFNTEIKDPLDPKYSDAYLLRYHPKIYEERLYQRAIQNCEICKYMKSTCSFHELPKLEEVAVVIEDPQEEILYPKLKEETNRKIQEQKAISESKHKANRKELVDGFLKIQDKPRELWTYEDRMIYKRAKKCANNRVMDIKDEINKLKDEINSINTIHNITSPIIKKSYNKK